MEPEDVHDWLREAVLGADPGLVDKPAGLTCPGCGGTWLAVAPEKGGVPVPPVRAPMAREWGAHGGGPPGGEQ